MMKVNVISVLIMINFYLRISGAQSLGAAIDFKKVEELSSQIGNELLRVAETVTRRDQLQADFSQAKAEPKNGKKIVEEIAKDLEAMLDIRIRAVKQIVSSIQSLPKVHENDTFLANYSFLSIRERDKHRNQLLAEKKAKNEELEKKSQDPDYKKPRKPDYSELKVCYKSENKDDDDDDGDDDDDDFKRLAFIDEVVNVKSKEAGVFFPLDVYDKDINMSKIAYRSRLIDKAFVSNYQEEPTIGWQYFCNSSGLFRQFPATNWTFYPMNTYDCRMRPWFTNAASSSKDIVVLIEKSGSMKGSRLDIAIDVVRNILDTLTVNDFVNVFEFSESFRSIMNCSKLSNETLIQATSSNIFDLKQALKNIKAKGQTDLAEALNHTFYLLNSTRRSGAHCNQAIMLITDGMEYNETIRDVFEKFNWKRSNDVRVFSYLIGEMIPEHDYEQVKLMACENRGYYVQIDTKTETREQVLKYIPVMSRPLALTKNQNPIIWTTVYADLLDAFRVTNYNWDILQRRAQRERAVNYLKHYQNYPCITDNEEEDGPELRRYVFMTTVAMPAFEQEKNSSQLMGVAGVDVPLYEFERLLQQFRLGVNGYAFVIDENGNILTHPDFRPFFQKELLKPSYNSVDMLDVELFDDDNAGRKYDPEPLKMREAMINNSGTASSKSFNVIQHLDDLRRVMRFKRHYYWKKINKTPFTVVVTFPDDAPSQVQIPEHVVDSMTSKGSKVMQYFKLNYRLHPQWIYCRSLRKHFEDMKLGDIDPDNCEMTPEEELEYFLEKFEKSGWKWRTAKNDKGAYKCDQKLMQALLYDAKVTQNYPHEPTKSSSKQEKKLFDDYEIRTSFVATHSGLLRYKIFGSKEEEEDEDKINFRSDEFGRDYKNSIDEDWYKHTAYFNKREPKSFIYSLPFNANNESLITATTTVYARDAGERAPIAVVGFQFPQAKFAKLFESELCAANAEQTCFILDDNAYIVANSRFEHEGKFFGSVERKIMRILIDDNIYTSVDVYDYQAVCYDDKDVEYDELMDIVSSASSALIFNPLKALWAALVALLTSIGEFFRAGAVQQFVPNLMYPDSEYYYKDDPTAFCPDEGDGSLERCMKSHGNFAKGSDDYKEAKKACEKDFETRDKECRNDMQWEYILKRHLTKTRPRKCDKINAVYLLNLDESNFRKPYNKCERPFLVQRIGNSNLILLVTKSDCEKNTHFYSFNEVPTENVNQEESLFCSKLRHPLYRRHSKSCLSRHVLEPLKDENKTHCGGSRGNRMVMSHKLLLIPPVILMMLKFL